MSNAIQNHGPTYYEILGANPMDQLERIEDLFRQLAYEAEQSGDHSRIPQVVNAFKVLRDPAQRHLYDQHLAHARGVANQNSAVGQPASVVETHTGGAVPYRVEAQPSAVPAQPNAVPAQPNAVQAQPNAGTVPSDAEGQLGSHALPSAATFHRGQLAAAQQSPQQPSQHQTATVYPASAPLNKPAEQPIQDAGPLEHHPSLERSQAPPATVDTPAYEEAPALQETPITSVPTVDTPDQQALSPVDAMVPARLDVNPLETAAPPSGTAGPASSPPPTIPEADENTPEPPSPAEANQGQQNSSSEFCAHTGAQRRRELLAMFYKRRRQDIRAPGIGIGGIDQKVGYDYETLEFHLWYMLEKKWLWREESGMLSITYSGVEQYESDQIEGLA